jgi:hypothetical protein
VTKSAWITVGIALLLVWMLSFLVFKVAGFLIHLLLVRLARGTIVDNGSVLG